MGIANIASSMVASAKKLPRKVFGSRNDRLLKSYVRRIPAIAELEQEMRGDFDEQLAKRQGNGSPPEGEEEAAIEAHEALQVELSADLLERTKNLRERVLEAMKPLNSWWQSLSPSQQVEVYHKEDYRNRYSRILDQLDRDGISTEVFAVIREASRRAQDHRHFDCQLVGGRVLSEGKIAEMRTGEGKTIVCHVAAFLQVLCGHKVNVITVNDYLVKRDAEFAMPIFKLLGISVGFIQSQIDPSGREGIRQNAYDCDITFGTNSEFGFDYLRDNMKTQLADQVQGRLDYVIVDEVDSILIDEARTPLIISGPAQDDVTRYPRADKVAEELVRRQLVWDRKLSATIAKYDGDTHNIPKLGDAMAILGFKEREKSNAKQSDETDSASSPESDSSSSKGKPTLGPDFLTDDQAEAIQIYEASVLGMTTADLYRRYFIVQTERKQVGITHDGVTIAQELLDLGSLYSGANMEWPHLIENALRARKVYQRDVEYVVQKGEVIIVDTFTGRLMHGRQWSDGLHQAVEAKERVSVKEETQTLATITIQNFIKLYQIKAGMTGTALTEVTEFDKIYKLEVVEIPTNRPVNRIDYNDKMYRSVEQKYEAIVEEIHEIHTKGRPADPFVIADALVALKPIIESQGADTTKIKEAIAQFKKAEVGDNKVIRFMLEAYDESMGDLARGRPVLVGTTSVDNSEKLASLLDRRYGIEHEILNAKNHAREAEIVTKAGHTTTPSSGGNKMPRGNVTIATNMAGRGTDIKLGEGVVYAKCKTPTDQPEGAQPSALYPPGITKCCMNCEEYDPATNCAHCFKPKIDSRFPEMGRKICPINVPCGLHIIATERHDSRRIDNQLRGRAGRQGDPGSSRFSLSLQDDLLKLFMSEWMLKMMERLGFTEGSSLEDKRLTKGIERAQRKVEERNYSSRKHLLEWDEPMDFQRKEFYTARQRILEGRDLTALIFQTIDNTMASTVSQYLARDFARDSIARWCHANLDLQIDVDTIDDDDLESAQRSIRKRAKDEALEQVQTSIGEYIDTEEPANKWDIGGLLQWAQRSFQVSMTQNQMRKMDPDEIENALTEAAERHYDQVDLSSVALFLGRDYARDALAEWARNKFNIEVESSELADMPEDEVTEVLEKRIRDAYREREIRYPVEAAMERAFGDSVADGPASAEFLANWANSKFNLGWSAEDVQSNTPEQVHDYLLETSKKFSDGAMAEEIDKALASQSREESIEWAKGRFGRAWDQDLFDRSESELREALIEQGQMMLRWELSRLEQFVLLRIYDQCWKDHLLEMDHLKTAIMQRPLGGDQAHPQSQYAIEGRDLFTQMWNRIAGRVTDIVFKVRTGAATPTPTAATTAMSFNHAEATNQGFTAATRDQEAAMKAQGAETKVETIRREKPKVGRNEPCPCGSGKKFKNCHGKKQ